MATEAQIMSGLETAIEELTNFDTGDVVINDFRVYDQWVGLSPYFILSNSDEFDLRRDSSERQDRWSIGGTLVVQWEGWKTALDNFRTHREDIVAKLWADDHSTAGGLAGVTIQGIRSSSPILPWNPNYVENAQEMAPVFIFQDWIIEAETF